MSRRPVISTILTIVALVLLLNFRSPDMPAGAAAQSPAAVSAPPPALSIRGGGAAPSQGATASSAAGSGASSGQFAGTAVQTPYGTVQVQVTISGGKIADVTALQLPGGNRRSTQIAQYAAPQLRSEVLTAQSANVDTVSGATYTSQGYIASLQAALAAAKFA